MFCPAGHTIDALGKKLRLWSHHYVCTRCGGKVSERGGLYHKCSNRCDFRLCQRCYDHSLSRHYVLDPCNDVFPDGLGPFSLHRSSLLGGELRPFDVARGSAVSHVEGGAWALGGAFFERSTSGLASLWQGLVSNGLTMASPPGLFPPAMRHDRCLSVLVSPSAPVNLPEHARRGMNIPEGSGLLVAWMYPARLEWQLLADDIAESALGGADWSLLTVGGFVFMRQLRPGGALEVLCANAIAYSPRGVLNFSAPQPWQPRWTEELIRAGRFQKVTAQKWAAAGAQYICWVAPDEPLVAPRGLHGGFAFLFRGLEEPDTATAVRFFELVTALGPTDSLSASVSAAGGVPPMLQRSAFAFSLAGDPALASPVRKERTKSRFLRAANDGRWALVGHMLGEWPHLASEADLQGQTVLHKCAALKIPGGRKTCQLLTLLHQAGASIEAQDMGGQTPYDLGDKTFKALVCQIWGLIPDLFADPELWFDYWDKNRDGILSPEELIPALAAAYQAGDLGRQWIETYVRTHYRELAPGAQLTREAMLGDKGMLHMLQSSEEFISLRAKEEAGLAKMPAIFRTEGRLRPTTFDRQVLTEFAARLEATKAHNGWMPGRPPPPSAKPLEVRAPFAGGDSDPHARLAAAREMLAWSFTKTTALPGSAWLDGFKISFRGGGDAGIDEGGLTKAWCQEIAHALWADDSFFDTKSTGSFFKPDSETDVVLHCFHVKSESLYRWMGRFLAYAVYQNCVVDCRLCPWALRWLVRVAEARAQTPAALVGLAGDWRMADGEGVATIAGAVLFFDETPLGWPCQEMALSMRGGRVIAEGAGVVMTADAGDGKLAWSTGETWERCGESSCAMPSWPETPQGNAQLLEDLATMDAAFANSLWRVHYEMPVEDLQWLNFSYAGVELEPGGEDREVDETNKSRYVRLCCKAVLLQQARRHLKAFAEGFYDVLPEEFAHGMPADCFFWLLCGDDEISTEQLDELERLVLSDGLVPQHLCDNPAVQESARWVFRTARASDGKFRSRLLEFWTGTPRLPQGGAHAIAPRPRLQVMVQAARAPGPPTWEICLGDGWYSYDADTSAALTRAQDQGQRQVHFQVRDNKYTVDVVGMVQVNQRTGARRSVRRRDRLPEDSTGVVHGVRRIETWPATRLPEGHTCGNELWVPLCESEAELARSLHTAVMNFEAGFALA